MDFEEFSWATKAVNYEILKQVYDSGMGLGQAVNRKVMRDLRIYMAVGGMPQAVEAYISGKNFAEIDAVKRNIIKLYEDDFKKLDKSGKLSAMYKSIPAQLSKGIKRFSVSQAVGSRKSTKDDERIFDLIDSKAVLPAYNTTDPRVSLAATKDLSSYKLYVADTGIFVTLMFIDRPITENEIYMKLLSDKLPANLGYLYENLVAQMIAASGRELYYHTWQKRGSTHYYEVDFLISAGAKVNAIEVKSSGVGKHESLTEFQKKYSKTVKETIVFSQKDRFEENGIKFLPFYLAPFVV